MLKSFRSEKSAELFHQPGLEYWFKERRTLIDFRRGPLGSYVDGFAAYLKAKGYSYNWGRKILGMCCHFKTKIESVITDDAICYDERKKLSTPLQFEYYSATSSMDLFVDSSRR